MEKAKNFILNYFIAFQRKYFLLKYHNEIFVNNFNVSLPSYFLATNNYC